MKEYIYKGLQELEKLFRTRKVVQIKVIIGDEADCNDFLRTIKSRDLIEIKPENKGRYGVFVVTYKTKL